MNNMKNPFEYEGANNLSPEDVIDFYIEDHNFSRFIQSTRNIMLIGERGSGKTMALIYNSFKIQSLLAKKNNTSISYEKIGIHIPCNTPFFHKKEHMLLETEFKKTVICEHYLVLSIMYELSKTLCEIEGIENFCSTMSDTLFDDFEYMLDIQLCRDHNFFKAVNRFISKEINLTQRQINAPDSDAFYDRALSFSSIIIPFINIIKQVEQFKESHFLFMFDDAHDMNQYQIRTLNSWIAYRDHSMFSFKVATAKVNRPDFITSTGGAILEGHDYITVDLEKSYQNEKSEFYQLATDIIKRRLNNVGLTNVSVDEFFPTSPELMKALESSKKKAQEDAIKKYPKGSKKQIDDYVYKYSRVEYFRQRADKANTPRLIYSGFDSIVDISTGVIRNLLDPCYWMFDAVLSKKPNEPIHNIPHAIQSDIIIGRSKTLWENLQSGLNKMVEDCTEDQARSIYKLFDNLMILFSKRLMEDCSEPRAIVFTISQADKYPEQYKEIVALLNIAQKAQFLYTRISSGKEKGTQDIYYVPNRLLLPYRGLDPHGQYSRVSLKLSDIYNTAKNNASLPVVKRADEMEVHQTTLFD